MVIERDDVVLEDTWDIQHFFSSWEKWEKAFESLKIKSNDRCIWPQIAKFQEAKSSSSQLLLELLDCVYDVRRSISKLYAYANLRHDEDVSHISHKEYYNRVSLLYFDFECEVSWIQPFILQLPQQQLDGYLKDPVLKKYQMYLKHLYLLKPYTLDKNQERLLASSSKPLATATNAFGLLNNAELVFENVLDSNGESYELTHGKYSMYLQSKDRELRKNAAVGLHNVFQNFEHTISSLLEGHVYGHIFHANARGYTSSLQAALSVHCIDVDIYSCLIDTVSKHLDPLHRYIQLRKDFFNYPTLHYYDLYHSLSDNYEKTYSYQEAVDLIVQAMSPLGDAYCDVLKQGLLEWRWVDRYENARKRSGAYSSGCYDSCPYILMNFQGTLRDVFTLAHEAGHSMHSYYSNQSQPFHMADYPIFLAEIASTFNEELLFRFLLDKAVSSEERCYLLNQKIDDIRSTLFRQTKFAEFELLIHQLGEQGVPLTANTLKQQYRKLCRKYYGEHLVLDDVFDAECLRIPHFYSDFYVYQYATGIAASNFLVNRVYSEGVSAKEDYIKFLSSGSSMFPLDLLKSVGVDMTSSEIIKESVDYFSLLITKLNNELNK